MGFMWAAVGCEFCEGYAQISHQSIFPYFENLSGWPEKPHCIGGHSPNIRGGSRLRAWRVGGGRPPALALELALVLAQALTLALALAVELAESQDNRIAPVEAGAPLK